MDTKPNDSQWLVNGPQTQITSTIQTVADSFKVSDFQLTFDILRWIQKNLPPKKLEPHEQDQYLWNLTANQVLKNGFSTGCTDSALVFAALCRAQGLPAQYIEALRRDWLTSNDGQAKILGHAFVKVKIVGDWYVADPAMGTLALNLHSQMIIYGTSLDAWDIGINNQNWRGKFLVFRQLWQKQNPLSTSGH